MNEITRLSNALALLAEHDYDKESIRALTKNIVDDKHQQYIDVGLMNNDKNMIMRGIVGALSHYEAKEDIIKKKIHALKHDY